MHFAVVFFAAVFFVVVSADVGALARGAAVELLGAVRRRLGLGRGVHQLLGVDARQLLGAIMFSVGNVDSTHGPSLTQP